METKTTTEAQWDAMTPAQRARVLKRDRSMRDRHWVPLVQAMSACRFEQLSGLQKGAVTSLLPEVL